MASRLAHRLLGTLALVLTLLVAVPLHAQDSPNQSTAAKVLRLVKDANDEFDRGEFDDALELYQEAYDLYPDAVLLYRIGLSAEKIGNKRRAVEAYQAFVAAAKSDDATAQALAKRADELLATIPPRVTLTTTPAGADVLIGDVDGRPLGQTPGAFDVPEGEIVVLLRLEGYKLEKRTFNLKNGQDEAAEVTLEQLEGLVVTDPVKPVEPTSSGKLAIWGWASTGLGVALLGTGTAFAIMTTSATKDVNNYDKQAPGASRAELDDLKDKANGRHSVAVGTLAAGGVFTALGVTLLIVDKFGSKEETKTAIGPNLGFDQHGAWVGLSGRF